MKRSQFDYLFELFLISIVMVAIPVRAEIVLDGSLGPGGALAGPDFVIGAELGQQYGGNLFHSFSQFDLSRDESATFFGPDSVSNIIGRVTGGRLSSIDGLLRSTIPDADVYLLNPSGILFGAHASLEVLGSFHASTADTLRFEDGGRFNASQPGDSLLTVAPVVAFGFLDETVAPISVVEGRLEVPSQKTLSLIGGNLEINKRSEIVAPWGRVNLAGVAPAGEVIPTASGLEVSAFEKLGDITFSDQSFVDTSGSGGGSVFIRGGRFLASDSVIFAETLGNQDGGVVDIQADTVSFQEGAAIIVDTYETGRGSEVRIQAAESITFVGENEGAWESVIEAESHNGGDSGSVWLEAKNLFFQEGGGIIMLAHGAGQSGNITLKASESVTIAGESSGQPSAVQTANGTNARKDAGQVLIEAKNIFLENGARIIAVTLGKGNAGNITIRAENRLSLMGVTKNLDFPFEGGSKITVVTGSKESGANAGNLLVSAREILLTDGAQVVSSTFGVGNGGNIDIKVTDTLTVAGTDPGGWAAGIYATSLPQDEDERVAGGGGQIKLEAGALVLQDGGQISASTSTRLAPNSRGGPAGDIIIRVLGGVKLSGVNPYGENKDGFGSGIYVRSVGTHAGNAGTLSLTAGSLSFTEGAVITSSTSSSATGGNITIHVEGPISIFGDSADIVLRESSEAQLEFREAFPNSQSDFSASGINASSSSTLDNAGRAGQIALTANIINIINGGSVNTSTNNAGGGNLTVTAPHLILQEGELTTSVKGGSGDGGNLDLQVPVFVVLNNAKIIAQAHGGRGGNISIVTGNYIPSSDSVVDASSQLGIDGVVRVDALNVFTDEDLVIFPTSLFDAEDQLQSPCNARMAENLSSFIIMEREGMPPVPDDFLPSGLLLSKFFPQEGEVGDVKRKEASVKKPVALLMGCRERVGRKEPLF